MLAAVRERGRLQSAALSLGAMHAQLGHIEEAMQALNETVGWGCQGSKCACHAGAWEVRLVLLLLPDEVLAACAALLRAAGAGLQRMRPLPPPPSAGAHRAAEQR